MMKMVIQDIFLNQMYPKRLFNSHKDLLFLPEKKSKQDVNTYL